LTTEVALEVIGVIGIAIIAGMAIYHIIEVFDDPDSTALDKVLSLTACISALYSLSLFLRAFSSGVDPRVGK
jgi:hypothetical protein